MKKNLLKFSPILLFTALFPMTAFAALDCSALTGIGKVICQMREILGSILPVLIGIGVVYFVWGMVMYFIADGEEAKTKGRDRIIYGIIGLVVATSVWGLVNIVVETFNIGGVNAPTLSTVAATTTCAISVGGAVPALQNYLVYATCVINSSVIPLMFAIAVVMFVWGSIKFFIFNADEEQKRTEGKQFMIWGVIALAVMISVWGLVNILGVTFNIGTTVLPQVKP